MIRMNRGRLIGILLTTFIIYFLFISSTNTSSDFRKRTEEGLSRRHGVLQGDLTDEQFRAQTNEKLDSILSQKGQKPLRASDEGTGPTISHGELKPQPAADEKPPKAAEEEDDDDKYAAGVAGRRTPSQRVKEKQKPKYPVGTTNADGKSQDSLRTPSDTTDDTDDDKTKPKPKPPTDPGKDLARSKLREYLKQPLVIFSKSYCPHSKNAKRLLLDMYQITPMPLVVELDQLSEPLPLPASADEDEHPRPAPTLGQKLQELLFEISGRRTVPNIMVGATTSIGGNDLIWQMHEEGTLADKLRELAGKRISSVELRHAEGVDGEGKS